jgi:N-sulfoglucosamine sulfohydrolase
MAVAHDVMLITTHDIGRHLGCYGAETVASPHLDRLASDGVRFARAFCTAPQCSPSRASLATGLYPHRNGVMGLAHAGFDWELQVPHAAAVLRGLGFESHLFGGQHVTSHPENLGFTRRHGQAADAETAAKVARLLTGAEPSQRLYLEINLEATHRPYPEAAPEVVEVDRPPFLPAGPESTAELRALQTAIAETDTAVGIVLAALERSGRAGDAIVVFTTDHGLAMPRAKCTLYDPGLEVALLIRRPAGDVGGGAVRHDLVSNVDVLPTLLAAAGADVPPDLDGRPLFGSAPREEIFAEKTFHSYYDPMRCVRTDKYKYIRNFEQSFAVEVPGDVQAGAIFRADPTRYSRDRPSIVELYDLVADPLETVNLAGTPDHRELEQALGERLWRWMEQTGDPLLKGPVPSPRYLAAMRRPPADLVT